MEVTKGEEKKSQVELTVQLSVDEFKPYLKQGAKKISQEVKIDGFRPGKIPYEVLKQKIGEMSILEESARIAINKTLEEVLKKVAEGRLIGQPQISITKLAPENPLEYKVTVSLIPGIKIGQYKDLGIKQDKIEVKEKEIDNTLKELKESRVKEMIADRAIKKGDKVLVDIEMFHDKVPVEGGQAKETGVLIGEEHLVPGFDKELLGAKKGETKEFSLPYPKDHYMKNIAGKMVDFKVKIKEIYERVLPEIDDEFAQGFGLKSLSELKSNIKKGIESQKKQEQSRQIEKQIIERIIEKSKFGDIPKTLIDQESQSMLRELEQGITEQGGKFEDYLKSINKTETQLTLDILPDAIKRVKASLLIREIAKAEKIKVSSEEIEDHIKHMRTHYKDKPDILARLDSKEYRDYVVNVQTSRKVIDKLIKWNIAKK